MYLHHCSIHNIKCFADRDTDLDFRNPDEPDGVRKWNVLIGENGTGKTTLLRMLAITLMGEHAASVMLGHPGGWIRKGADTATIAATLVPGPLDADESVLANGGDATKIQADAPIQASYAIEKPEPYGPPRLINQTTGIHRKRLRSLDTHTGWFAAGYGPFRRLNGGSNESQKIIQQGYREARFITLFREDAALTDCADWLMQLDYARKDQDTETQERDKTDALLDTVRTLLNDYLLPQHANVHLNTVNSKGVFFKTPYADAIALSDLSDGYRAMLVIGIDILRHISTAYAAYTIHQVREASGVVLIDELDAHLHPVWQREVGVQLKTCFPRLQFIVTTHSPFIPQIADDEGIFVLHREDNRVRIVPEAQSVRGWRVDQILAILFDAPGVYNTETEQQVREYTHLQALAQSGKLSEDQRMHYDQLHTWITQHLAPPGDTREQLEHYRHVKQRAEALSALLRKEST